jgi:hypothetical protein
MRERRSAWTICLLIAVIAAILPAAIFPDFLIPFGHWDNMDGPAAVIAHKYSGVNLPAILKVETAVFKALVVPPSFVPELFGRWRTEYARLVWPDQHQTEVLASTPPFFVALENFKVALPFWFLVCVFVFEVSRRLRLARRLGRAA